MTYHTVYKTTNKINGKFYYGVHSTNDLNDDYLGSGLRLKLSMKKHGRENFERKILVILDDRSEAVKIEKSLVTEDLVLNANCYNMTLGGNAPPKQKSQNLCKNKFRGNDRTEKQKAAARLHSNTMKGRTPHNVKKITLFGVEFPSLRLALEYYSLSTTRYYFMINSGIPFVSIEELKKYDMKSYKKEPNE